MRILTYQALQPTGLPFLAYIEVDGEFLPVRFSDKTEDGARARAQTHWDEAMQKQQAPSRRGRPKKTLDIDADPGDVI